MRFTILFLTICLFSSSIQSATSKPVVNRIKGKFLTFQKELLVEFEKKNIKKISFLKLKKKTLALEKNAVPVLIEVMKSSKYPEKNRWAATFLLGRIMGIKAAPFISKFSKHPSWIMRMASLKTLLALSAKDYGPIYAELLNDKSLLVRTQALENIKSLRLVEYAPYVWKMLYDSKNYAQTSDGKNKRTNIVKSAITTVGILNFKKAEKPLLAMIQKKKYKDIFKEVDQALSMILGKQSPEGTIASKRRFWNKISIANKIL